MHTELRFTQKLHYTGKFFSQWSVDKLTEENISDSCSFVCCLLFCLFVLLVRASMDPVLPRILLALSNSSGP